MDMSFRSVARRRAILAALVALISLAAAVTIADLTGLISVGGSEARAEEVAGALKIGLRPGNLAPDFTLPSVSGVQVRLSQFRGQKPVLLNLWSVTCGPCRQELSEIKTIYPEYRDKVEILSVQVDSRFKLPQVTQLATELGLPHVVLADESYLMATLYQVAAVPANYFIDDRGIIRSVRIGSMSGDRLKAEMDLLLK